MNKRTRDNELMPPAGGNVLTMPAAVPRPGDVVAELLRNGYLPHRELQTGVGPVAVQVPRAWDSGPAGAGRADPVPRDAAAALPATQCGDGRTAAVAEGHFDGGFGEALEALVGPQARGLSSCKIS